MSRSRWMSRSRYSRIWIEVYSWSARDEAGTLCPVSILAASLRSLMSRYLLKFTRNRPFILNQAIYTEPCYSYPSLDQTRVTPSLGREQWRFWSLGGRYFLQSTFNSGRSIPGGVSLYQYLVSAGQIVDSGLVSRRLESRMKEPLSSHSPPPGPHPQPPYFTKKSDSIELN